MLFGTIWESDEASSGAGMSLVRAAPSSFRIEPGPTRARLTTDDESERVIKGEVVLRSLLAFEKGGFERHALATLEASDADRCMLYDDP
jgi:hypothetical protein